MQPQQKAKSSMMLIIYLEESSILSAKNGSISFWSRKIKLGVRKWANFILIEESFILSAIKWAKFILVDENSILNANKGGKIHSGRGKFNSECEQMG